MKTTILALVSFCLLLSCKEEEVRPKNPFVGSWSFDSPEIQIAFDVVLQANILNYVNRQVVHPSIPTEEQGNNQIITYDKFANGNGYGRIEIASRGYVYYRIILIYNRFTEDGNMAVYDVQVDIAGQPFFVLTDRVFIKTTAN